MKPKYSTSLGNFVSEISSIDSKVAETDVTSDDGFGVNLKTQGPPPCRLEWKKVITQSKCHCGLE